MQVGRVRHVVVFTIVSLLVSIGISLLITYGIYRLVGVVPSCR